MGKKNVSNFTSISIINNDHNKIDAGLRGLLTPGLRFRFSFFIDDPGNDVSIKQVSLVGPSLC